MNDIQKFYLLESGRWEKIIGIYMVVCAALMALLGLFFIIGGIAGLDLFEMGGGGALGMAAGIGMGLFYILIGVLYYFFARFLLRAAKAVKAWGASEDEAELTDSLRNTKYFFQVSGVLSIIGIAIFSLLAVVLLIVGIVSLF